MKLDNDATRIPKNPGRNHVRRIELLHDDVAQVHVVVRPLFDFLDPVTNTPRESLLVKRNVANIILVNFEGLPDHRIAFVDIGLAPD